MDYQHRGLRWYWTLLYVVYSVGAVYFLLMGNPYLYSHDELKKQLAAAPDQKSTVTPAFDAPGASTQDFGVVSYFDRFNERRTAASPPDNTYYKGFLEKSTRNLDFKPDAFQPNGWAIDASGIYLNGGAVVMAYRLDGEKKWEFRFSDKSKRNVFDLITDQVAAYVAHPSGKIVALSKDAGGLVWTLNLKEEIIGPAWMYAGKLLVPVRTKAEGKIPRPMFRWAVVKRKTGELESYSRAIEGKPFTTTYSPDLKLLLLSYDNKLVAVDPDRLEVAWTQTLTDPVLGPAVVVGETIFVATLGGKIVRLDGEKKGRVEWEADLERPPVSAPAYLPLVGRLSVIDDQNQLVTVDTKTGKVIWKTNVDRKSPLKETWSSRMKGSVVQEAQMEWSHRGWAIWSPCSQNRVCIYNPAKGQLVSRLPLPGAPLALPLELEKSLYFLVSRAGSWAITHIEQEKKKTDAE